MKIPKVTKKLAVSNLRTRIKVVLTWIVVMVFGYGVYFAWNMFPVIAGYGAKSLCSCVYLQGRNDKEVIKAEFNTLLGMVGSASINREDSSAIGRVLFFPRKKAIYRKGFGCTLVNGIDEEELRAQKFIGKTNVTVNQDTIAWPDGNMIADTLPNGLNKEALDKLVANEFIDADPETAINTRSIIVLYDGKIVSEVYADGFTASMPQMGWSMNKSITNALIGILVHQGKLNVNEPPPIPEWTDDDRKKILLTDLMHASSGLEWSELYNRPSDAVDMLFRSGDAGAYAISQKAKKKPNEKFYYSSGTTNILSKLMRMQVGDAGYHRFPYERLFNKIGMTSTILEPDPSGTYVGSSFGYATARDWARFGLLYLNDGVWNGERILPEGWVKYTTTPAPAAPKGEYGAQWWLNAGAKDNPANRKYPDVPPDSFQAEGFEGQYVFVVPSKKLVVVRLGLSQKALPDMNKLVAGIIGTLPK
jgi:CubicO group peptidase (beta-lactamase class C family)